VERTSEEDREEQWTLLRALVDEVVLTSLRDCQHRHSVEGNLAISPVRYCETTQDNMPMVSLVCPLVWFMVLTKKNKAIVTGVSLT
jgi:hypothetical protein